jgi:hypothetical protein
MVPERTSVGGCNREREPLARSNAEEFGDGKNKTS